MCVAILLKALLELEMTSLGPRLSGISVNSSMRQRTTMAAFLLRSRARFVTGRAVSILLAVMTTRFACADQIVDSGGILIDQNVSARA